jgi:hypothetical protein
VLGCSKRLEEVLRAKGREEKLRPLGHVGPVLLLKKYKGSRRVYHVALVDGRPSLAKDLIDLVRHSHKVLDAINDLGGPEEGGGPGTADLLAKELKGALLLKGLCLGSFVGFNLGILGPSTSSPIILNTLAEE